MKRVCMIIWALCFIFSTINSQNVKRTYDEFTGDTQIAIDIGGPLEFVKSISESGEIYVLLKWNSSSRGKPENDELRLIILFDDQSRLSINLPIVCKYDEFMTNLYLKTAIETSTVIDPTWYSLQSEFILNASQIATFKSKSIKKYRLDGYREHDLSNRTFDSKIIFNEMLNMN